MTELTLCKRMNAAIQNVAAVFNPQLQMTGDLVRQRSALATMPLITLADIERWEAGWLKLIESKVDGSRKGASHG